MPRTAPAEPLPDRLPPYARTITLVTASETQSAMAARVSRSAPALSANSLAALRAWAAARRSAVFVQRAGKQRAEPTPALNPFRMMRRRDLAAIVERVRDPDLKGPP